MGQTSFWREVRIPDGTGEFDCAQTESTIFQLWERAIIDCMWEGGEITAACTAGGLLWPSKTNAVDVSLCMYKRVSGDFLFLMGRRRLAGGWSFLAVCAMPARWYDVVSLVFVV